MNVRLDLQFDGTDYHGWQVQPDCLTVQGLMQNAIYKATGEDIKPQGSSRTDAGVHATGFVCNFKTSSSIPCERLPFALNTYLPSDIRCIGAEIVPEDFNASRSALAKTYRYTIDNSLFGDVLRNRYSWHYKYKLDIDKMKEASKHFIGTYDFVGFASSGYSVETTVRTIYELNTEKNDNIITIDVKGNGFLYNMVRIITGTLVYVGGGKIAPDDIPHIINYKDRTKAGITAPAKGLCLKEVFY